MLLKSIDEFNWRDKAHTKLQSYCRDCSNRAWRRWYREETNRRRHLDTLYLRRRRRIDRHQQLITELKSQPCADCGQVFPPYAMDFDHLGDKASSSQPSFIRPEQSVFSRRLGSVRLCVRTVTG